MADEAKSDKSSQQKSDSGSGGKSGGRRSGRRRYFRRNKNKSSDNAEKKADGKSGSGKKGGRSDGSRRSSSRRGRRRRRSKSQSDVQSGPSIVQEIDTNYVPPESVFVYTHVLRPDQRDNYTFRSEIASGTGRQLADFNLDLSLIFPPDGDPIPQTAARSVERATAQYKDEPKFTDDDDSDDDDSDDESDEPMDADEDDGA